LLFGGCFGGNITLVGSTANIVALGILEKEKNIRITFFRWFWVGLLVGTVTTSIVWLALVFFPLYK
jgi:Na+/H+ antiporter NhaD/arsenite permease-like protein